MCSNILDMAGLFLTTSLLLRHNWSLRGAECLTILLTNGQTPNRIITKAYLVTPGVNPSDRVTFVLCSWTSAMFRSTHMILPSWCCIQYCKFYWSNRMNFYQPWYNDRTSLFLFSEGSLSPIVESHRVEHGWRFYLSSKKRNHMAIVKNTRVGTQN